MALLNLFRNGHRIDGTRSVITWGRNLRTGGTRYRIAGISDIAGILNRGISGTSMDADGVSMVTETSGSGVDGMATEACGVGVGRWSRLDLRHLRLFAEAARVEIIEC